jgi:drug/metabolite transporter (DMT)-like permease
MGEQAQVKDLLEETRQTQTKLKQALIPITFVFLWSSGAIFVELGLYDTKPLNFLSLRLVFSAMIMWLIYLRLKPSLPTQWIEWRDILLTGLLLQAGYQIFFFLALAYDVSPGMLAIILGAQPILTAVLSREKTTKNQWLGLLLGILGLTLVVGHSILEGTVSFAGIGSALLSLVSITIGTIWQKRITLNLPANMAIQYTGSSLVLIVLALMFESYAVSWTIRFGIALTWMVLIISIASTLLLYLMIRRGNLTNVTSLFYCVPPVTALLDYFIFGHTLQLVALIGMALIVGGLILVNQKGKLV